VAKRLLAAEGDTQLVTTVQALDRMSIFEASWERQSQSIYYSGQSIRMAVEMGLHLDVDVTQIGETAHEVRNAAIWVPYC
jgi:hypothetical protein